VSTRPPSEALEWDGHVESAADLARRLATLHAVDEQGQPLASAGVLNLVTVTRVEDALEFEAIIESLSDHQPSRAIIVERAWDGEGIDAHLETRTQMFGGAKRESLVELVRLTLHGETTGGAASAVRSLLRADLPVYLWWPGAPDLSDPVYAEVAEGADRVVTEAGRGPNAVTAVLQLADAALAGPALTDLAWAELTPWRQLVNQLVDLDHIERLRQGAVAEIWHCGPAPTVSAYLLAGWLRDTLGEKLHVELHPRRDLPEGGVVGLQLESLAGRRLVIDRFPDRATAAVVVSSPTQKARRRVLPLPYRDRARLLAGELELQRRDHPFERALPHAREVATR